MIKGIDINQRIEYTLSSDKEEVKTIFVVRPLSGLEMMDFSEGNRDDIFRMLKKSIVEIKNFSTTSVDDAINSLDIKSIGELINKINQINNLTGQDEKN